MALIDDDFGVESKQGVSLPTRVTVTSLINASGNTTSSKRGSRFFTGSFSNTVVKEADAPPRLVVVVVVDDGNTTIAGVVSDFIAVVTGLVAAKHTPEPDFEPDSNSEFVFAEASLGELCTSAQTAADAATVSAVTGSTRPEGGGGGSTSHPTLAAATAIDDTGVVGVVVVVGGGGNGVGVGVVDICSGSSTLDNVKGSSE